MTISPASSTLVPPTRIVPPTDNLLPNQKATPRPGEKVEAEVAKPANTTTDIVQAKREAPSLTGDGGGIDIRV